MTEADTRITLSQASHVGMEKGGGTGNCQGAQIFSFPPLRSQDFTSLYGQKGEKIKKTYKITIEKVILLGKAPLRLGGVFVPFFPFFFFFLKKCSFPSAT